MDDLTAFLAARLDEDEALAKRAAGRDPGMMDFDSALFVGEFNPARVLREVAAKRAILAEYEPVAKNDGYHEPEYAYGWAEGLGAAVRYLATVYSDHLGYRQEWKP